jgi:uncharacterized protein (TIGR03546 family)
MTLILKQIFNLLKLLNSDTGEKSIALGFALGMILGFAPFFSLQTVFVILILFVFKVQIGAALCASFFFAIFAFILDPVFHHVGVVFLEMSALRGLYETLYALPIIPFSKFYNSIVMGSMIVSFALAPVTYFVSIKLIVKYRSSVVEKYKQSKFFKALKATSFYKWYAKYSELYG